MKSWKSTLGGALSALGTALMGVGVLTDKNSDNIAFLHWVAIVGFLLSAIGTFFAHLWAADAGVVRELSRQVDANTSNIATTATAVQSGDTAHLKRDMVKKET